MTTLFIVNKLWFVIFGLTAIIILLLLFQPNAPLNDTTAWKDEINRARDKAEKLAVKHKTDSTASAQKLAQLRDSLFKEQRHGKKLTLNLARLRANPIVIRVQDSIPEIKATFAAYDSLLESKDQQLKIQADMIEAQRIENVRITSNFMERLALGQQAFDAQKAIADSLAKDNRKKNRGIKALKVAVVLGTVGGLFLGSSF